MTQTIVRELAARDLDVLPPIHIAAFKGTLGVTLGRRYVKAFLRWFLEERSAVKLVAETAGRVDGYVIGAPASTGASITRDLLPAIAVGLATHPWMLADRRVLTKARARIGDLIGRGAGTTADASTASATTPDWDPFCLTAIGVAPQSHGRGVGGMLVEAFQREVSARGFDLAILDVYEENAPARALYESRGWEQTVRAGHVLRYEKRLPVRA